MITKLEYKIRIKHYRKEWLIKQFNSCLVKCMTPQISYLVFYFNWPGTNVPSTMGLSVTKIVNNHSPTTVTKGTILDEAVA